MPMERAAMSQWKNNFMQRLYQTHDEIKQRGAEECHDGRQSMRVAVMALGNEITRREVEEGADKDGEHEPNG